MSDTDNALNERAHKALAGRIRPGTLVLLREGEGAPWPQRIESVTELVMRRPGVRVVGIEMSDPATRGAYLAVVREAWKCPTLHLVPRWARSRPSARKRLLGWKWEGLPDPLDMRAMTFAAMRPTSEAEALVAALEAAAKPKEVRDGG